MNTIINAFLCLSLLSTISGFKENSKKFNVVNHTDYLMEEVYVPEINYDGHMKDENEDDYELNDTYSEAINLCPDEYYLMDDYHTQLNAGLDYTRGVVDHDFYYFKLLEESRVSLYLYSSNVNSTYTFSLDEMEYIGVTDNGAYHTINTYSCVTNSLSYNSFEDLLLQAGTYYIYIGNYIANEDNVVMNYQLDLYISKTDLEPDARIGDLKFNKNCGGAVWISDLFPTKNQDVLGITDSTPYFKLSEQNLNYPDYALDDMMQISNGNVIRAANYYIWDEEILGFIKDYADKMVEETFEKFERQQKISVTYSMIENKIEKTISIVTTIIDAFNKSTIIEIIIGAVEAEILEKMHNFFAIINPKYDIEFIKYYTIMLEISNACEKSDSCLSIPIFYQLSINENIFPNYTEHIITRVDLCEYMFENDEYTFNEKYIPSSYSDAYTKGKIYGIYEHNDIYDIFNLQNVNDIENVDHVAEDISNQLDGPISIENLNDGEYKWIKFQTPSAQVDSKIYYFECVNPSGKESELFYIDIFDAKVDGYSFYNVIASKSGGYIINGNDGNIVEKGCYFSLMMEPNEIIYLRIRGDNFNEISSKSFQIRSSANPNVIHIHEYLKYTYINLTSHKAECNCGVYVTEPHVVKSGSKICLLCKGNAGTGFVGIMNVNHNEYILPEESYIMDNGVIVLTENDAEKYFRKELEFDFKN